MHAAVCEHPLLDVDAEATRAPAAAATKAEVAQVIPTLPADLERIAEARRRQERGRGALALDQGVGDQRRPVGEVVDRLEAEARASDESLDPVEDGDLGCSGRCGEFLNGHRSGVRVDEYEVREGAADVDADADRHSAPVARGVALAQHVAPHSRSLIARSDVYRDAKYLDVQIV